MGERTLNKNKLPPVQTFDDRAGVMRFSRTSENTPGPDASPPGPGPNKLVVEVQLQSAGAHWFRVYEKDLSPAFITQLNKICDDAAKELEG